MEKNYVEIQGRFSSDGRFVGGNYVPEVIDKLMNDVYSTLGQAGSLYRLRVTVEVEDLGAEVKFGKPASETHLDGYGPALEPPDDYYFLPRGTEQTEDQEDEE